MATNKTHATSGNTGERTSLHTGDNQPENPNISGYGDNQPENPKISGILPTETVQKLETAWENGLRSFCAKDANLTTTMGELRRETGLSDSQIKKWIYRRNNPVQREKKPKLPPVFKRKKARYHSFMSEQLTGKGMGAAKKEAMKVAQAEWRNGGKQNYENPVADEEQEEYLHPSMRRAFAKQCGQKAQEICDRLKEFKFEAVFLIIDSEDLENYEQGTDVGLEFAHTLSLPNQLLKKVSPPNCERPHKEYQDSKEELTRKVKEMFNSKYGKVIGKKPCAPSYQDLDNPSKDYSITLNNLPVIPGKMHATEPIHRPSWYVPEKCRALLANSSTIRMDVIDRRSPSQPAKRQRTVAPLGGTSSVGAGEEELEDGAGEEELEDGAGEEELEDGAEYQQTSDLELLHTTLATSGDTSNTQQGRKGKTLKKKDTSKTQQGGKGKTLMKKGSKRVKRAGKQSVPNDKNQDGDVPIPTHLTRIENGMKQCWITYPTPKWVNCGPT